MQDVQTTLPINSVIRERYVVEALLGRGGFGSVYRVRDQRVKGNVYALKEVIEPQRKDLTKKEREHLLFQGELLKRLDHPALPRVYRVFSSDANDRIFTLMDYIDGPNLEQLRQQQSNKRFPLADVLRIMAPISDALEYLHSQNPPIIHRDIKPSNIIVSAPHESVLVDFDIAKEYHPDSTTTAVRRCSPGYGAPEQYGQGTNTCTDIYGLAATIYTLLTGTVPPDALHRMTMQGARGYDPLVPIDQLVPSISPQVAATVQRAMALHSHDRYATIEEFWQDFDVHATIKEEAVSPVAPAPPASPVPQSVQSPASKKKRSGNTTTVPTQRLSAPAPTQPRKRTALWLVLFLLALFATGAGAASFWAFLGHHQNALSDTLKPHSQATVAISPISDPTLTPMPTATASALKKVPTLAPASSPTTLPVVPPSYPTAGSTPPAVGPTPLPTPQPTPQPTPPPPTPTPTPNPYPTLSGAYSGTVDDTTPTPHITTDMYLTSVQQNKGNIRGSFSVSAPLQGNGPFTGTIGTNNYIQFVVQGYNGNAPLYFWGFVQPNKSIKGQYCSLDSNGQCSASAGAGGYWYVAPGLPGS